MRTARIFGVAALILIGACGMTNAAPGAVTVEAAWITAPAGGDSAAAFATIHNGGATEDRLLSATTPRASMAMVHDMTMTNGVMSMRAMPAGLVAPAGGNAVLSPRGAHIMLMGISPPLRRGESVPIELTFQNAGKVTVQFAVMDHPPRAGHAAHK